MGSYHTSLSWTISCKRIISIMVVPLPPLDVKDDTFPSSFSFVFLHTHEDYKEQRRRSRKRNTFDLVWGRPKHKEEEGGAWSIKGRKFGI